ncbi:MAG: RNA polymerase sigma factor [Deltaproteobacteria bacterium]|nr:RNA polymerase sigma factor [Deltaproteobacteria bacterium]
MTLSNSHETDQELVARVLAGQIDDYAQLVQRHQSAIFTIAVRALGDRASATDITQLTFIQAYDHLAGFDGKREFLPWLNTIARNLVRDDIRKRERQHRYLAQYRSVAAPDIASAQTLEVAEHELHRALESCLQRLLPVAAEAVRLHYDEGLSLADAAAKLGRTVTATRQLLFRARVALRSCVELAGGFR